MIASLCSTCGRPAPRQPTLERGKLDGLPSEGQRWLTTRGVTVTFPKMWFYVPTHELPAGELPTSAEGYWEWVRGCREVDAWGPYDWTLQTYLHLKGGPVPCSLTHVLPPQGIVVTHRDFLRDDLRPGPEQLVVCIVGDREEPGLNGRHRYSQLFLVQNPRDGMLVRPAPLWEAAYIPFWPQSGLLPRAEARGATFENIAYFGYAKNLADPLLESAWETRLSGLGLRWRVVPRGNWHDYRDVDAVVAVRSFAGRDFGYKPATKLFQAWHAGVPAVLGQESAYAAERLHGLDYLEARTLEDAVAALRRLRDDPSLRRAMVENGKRRALESRPERIIERWCALLTAVATPAWNRWCGQSDRERERFFEERAAVVTA